MKLILLDFLKPDQKLFTMLQVVSSDQPHGNLAVRKAKTNGKVRTIKPGGFSSQRFLQVDGSLLLGCVLCLVHPPGPDVQEDEAPLHGVLPVHHHHGH